MVTGGRPFCIVDLLLHLLETGALRQRLAADEWLLDVGPVLYEPGRLSDVVPGRLRKIVGGQLARLEPPARELLMAGAALGNRFTFDQLCGVAGVAESVAPDALDTLLRAGLLYEEQETGCYGFCYDALRAAVCAEAGAARRWLFQKRALTLSGTEQTMPMPAQQALAGHAHEDRASRNSPAIPMHLVSTSWSGQTPATCG
jgi:hypothetical protein